MASHNNFDSDYHNDEEDDHQEELKDGNMKENRESLIRKMQVSIEEARIKLVNGQADEAFKMVFRTFKKASEVKKGEGQSEESKDDKVFQPAYFILGECCIETDDLTKAQDFLVAAFWTTVKKGEKQANQGNQEISEEDLIIKALRHRAFAKLFTKQNALEKAKDELAQAIYLNSRMHSPESTHLVKMYFDLAQIFLNQEDPSVEAALRYFKKILDIWFPKLCNFSEMEKPQRAGEGEEEHEEDHQEELREEDFDQIPLREGIISLKGIKSTFGLIFRVFGRIG